MEIKELYGVFVDAGIPKYMAIVAAGLVALGCFFVSKKLLRKREDVSRHAEKCPACDARLELLSSKRFDNWRWRCPKCEKRFWLPAPK